jgi:hypothetical protein
MKMRLQRCVPSQHTKTESGTGGVSILHHQEMELAWMLGLRMTFALIVNSITLSSGLLPKTKEPTLITVGFF